MSPANLLLSFDVRHDSAASDADVLADFDVRNVAARLAQRLFAGKDARQGWIRKLAGYPLSRWTAGRDLPALASKPFRKRWKELQH